MSCTLAALRLHLLDSFTLYDGCAKVSIPQVGQRLVAFVALNRRVTRAHAAGSLWPDADDEHAQANLRTTVWRVGRACAHVLDTDTGSIRLSADTIVDTDLLVTNARALASAAAQGQRLAQIPDLPLRGDLLPGWDDDWLVASRERMRQLQLHALEGAAEQHLARGCFSTALEAALTAAEVEPLRETTQRLIMRIHLAEGNVAEAVRSFLLFSDLLRRDLNVAPTERTRAVIAAAGVTALARPNTRATNASNEREDQVVANSPTRTKGCLRQPGQ